MDEVLKLRFFRNKCGDEGAFRYDFCSAGSHEFKRSAGELRAYTLAGKCSAHFGMREGDNA
jgi:hypothetical protein